MPLRHYYVFKYVILTSKYSRPVNMIFSSEAKSAWASDWRSLEWKSRFSAIYFVMTCVMVFWMFIEKRRKFQLDKNFNTFACSFDEFTLSESFNWKPIVSEDRMLHQNFERTVFGSQHDKKLVNITASKYETP